MASSLVPTRDEALKAYGTEGLKVYRIQSQWDLLDLSALRPWDRVLVSVTHVLLVTLVVHRQHLYTFSARPR